MQLFSITVQSNFFSEKYDHDEHREIAIEYCRSIKKLIGKHHLDREFDVEFYWRKGCVVLDMLFYVGDQNKIEEYIRYKDEFMNSELYKVLVEKLTPFQDDLKNTKISHKNKDFNLLKVVISVLPFKPRGEKIQNELLKLLSKN